jgi:hypothetical protein
MSPRSAEEIVADYYTGLEEAILTGKLNPHRMHFADDIIIHGAEGRIEGKAAAMKLLEEKLIPAFTKISIKHKFVDKSSVCTIVDCHAKHNHQIIPAADWHKVKNGVIYEMYVFSDSAKLVQAFNAATKLKKSA